MCPGDILLTKNPTWSGLETNLGLRSEKLVTDCRSQGHDNVNLGGFSVFISCSDDGTFNNYRR
jgi:hypothetical protein